MRDILGIPKHHPRLRIPGNDQRGARGRHGIDIAGVALVAQLHRAANPSGKLCGLPWAMRRSRSASTARTKAAVRRRI